MIIIICTILELAMGAYVGSVVFTYLQQKKHTSVDFSETNLDLILNSLKSIPNFVSPIIKIFAVQGIFTEMRIQLTSIITSNESKYAKTIKDTFPN